MEFYEVVKKRCSVREYKPDPVPRDVIERIIDAARLAPTARFEQPWEFIVVQDKGMRERIANITDYGKFIAQAPVCVAVVCKDTKYYLEDGCAATENILLAATAEGLGSCWVAGDKKPYCGEILRLLGVDEGYKLVALVAIGYPAGEVKPKQKRPLEDVLHWERF